MKNLLHTAARYTRKGIDFVGPGTLLALGMALLSGYVQTGFAADATGGIVSTITCAASKIYDNVLGNTAVLAAVVLVIIAWAGYQIYMGKREATDTIVKAMIATAIVIGAKTIMGWVVSGGSVSCTTGNP